MMNIDDNGLFKIFPAIETIANELEYQNSMLNKIVLTGKINALNIAENLFNFTEKTAQTFANLQTKLIENLLEENKKELFSKAVSKAQVAIDTLNRTLFERGADIQVLSKDEKIIEFLEGKILKDEIINRLNNYVSKYSIYNEIIIFDIKGNLKANVNKANKIRYSKDDILQKVQITDGYIQRYRKTDMFIKQRESLFFTHKIEKDGEVLGVLVMFVQFKEEMDKIFQKLVTDNEIITIVDKYNNVLASSEKGIDKNFVKVVNKFDEYVIANDKFHVKVKPKSYENYLLDDCYGITSFSRTKDINVMTEFNDVGDDRHLAKISLNNEELERLADDGYAILEDLSDVIINGELIAAKSKQYILIPILDNLREVSFRVVKLIELSISNLQKIIDESTENDVKGLISFIMDTLLRNLYERVNDVRWWAMTPLFQNELSKPNPSVSDLNIKLKEINDLYPMYSDIFLYDIDGKIIVSSNNTNLIGMNVDYNYTYSNKNSDKYFISPFEATKLYNNKPTYVFYASIIKDNKVVGGIGLVFDSLNQFKDILDSFMINKNGIALIVNKHRQVISSNDEKFDVLDEFNIDVELKDGVLKDIEFNSKKYKIAIKQSDEYREYKNNELYSVVMIEK